MSTTVRLSSTLTLFPKLPIEIRLKIWKIMCYIQRNVDITTEHFIISDNENSTTDYPYFYKSSCPSPAVLHVSQESRSEGLKHYQLDFTVKYEICFDQTQPATVTTKPKIYFNWKVDRLCIVDPTRLEGVENSEWQDRAQRLGRLCRKRRLQYLGYNCKGFIHRHAIFQGIVERAVWLQEITLFETDFSREEWLFSINFNKQCLKCPQGSCRCLERRKWQQMKYDIARLWKKQEQKSNEKAGVRFCGVTWLLIGRKGNVRV
jgi:hypothetical protein